MGIKYTEEELRKAVAKSNSIAGVLRYFNFPVSTGAFHRHIRSRLALFKIDVSHFPSGLGWARGKSRKPSSEVLVLRNGEECRRRTNRIVLMKAMIASGVPYVCKECGVGPTWNGKELKIQVDHIDGIRSNDGLQNLQFLCPNCHSQTKTFGSTRNPGVRFLPKKTKKERVTKYKITWPSEEDLSKMVKEIPITTIARNLGVSDVAVKKRCKKLGIQTPGIGFWTKKEV